MSKFLKSASSVIVVSAFLAASPSQVTKPRKAKAEKVSAPTKGTYQLPGDKGKIGVTYQLGDHGDELHFTLVSAQVAPYFKTPDDLVLGGEGQRLLVLNYNVQNPLKADMMLNSRSFKFTAVSPDDKNYDFGGYCYLPDTARRYQTMLKPAQKVRLIVAMPIYATGPIHKVIVQRDLSPVVRYDLEGTVKKMISTFRPDGLNLGDRANPKFGEAWDVNGFEVVVEKVEPRESPLGTYHAEDVGILFTVQYRITNLQSVNQRLNWTTLKATLTDTNGEKLDWATGLVSPSSGKEINLEIEPGESIPCVLIFRGTRAQKPAHLRLIDENGKRAAMIDLP